MSTWKVKPRKKTVIHEPDDLTGTSISPVLYAHTPWSAPMGSSLKTNSHHEVFLRSSSLLASQVMRMPTKANEERTSTQSSIVKGSNGLLRLATKPPTLTFFQTIK